MTPEQVKEWFEAIGAHKTTLRRLRARREALESPTMGSSGQPIVSGGEHGDPTARAALALIEARITEEETERQLADEIERCRRVCDGIGRATKRENGVILASHYIEGETWGVVARSIGVTPQTVYRMRDVAFDYVATVGLARAEEGMSIGEWLEHHHLPREC